MPTHPLVYYKYLVNGLLSVTPDSLRKARMEMFGLL